MANISTKDFLGGGTFSVTPPKPTSSNGSVSASDFMGGQPIDHRDALAAAQQPADQPSSGGFFQNLGNALTSSEQTLGKGLSIVGSDIPKQVGDINAQDLKGQQAMIAAIRASTDPVKKQRLIASMKQIYGSTPGLTQEELNPAFGLSNKQVIGAAAGTALDIGTFGEINKLGKSFDFLKAADTSAEAAKAAKATEALSAGEKLAKIGVKTAKTTAKGLGIGYGYDVTQGLQNKDESTADAFKPGLGTAIGGLIPGGVGAKEAVQVAGSDILKAEAPRVINSLIKPLLKDFSYGKNPGRTVAELGIKANTMEELGTKITAAKNDIGKTIGSLSDKLGSNKKVAVNAKSIVVDTIDKAMDKAATNNDTTVLNRLHEVKQALTQELGKLNTKEGPTIVSTGSKKLDNLNYKEALGLKQKIGELTKFTGNASDDKAVNSTLKQIYGKVKEAMNTSASEINPKLGKQMQKLNEQYADLSSAEIATKYRDKIEQRASLVKISPTLVGLGSGLATAFATGGSAVPTILAGLVGAGLDKAFTSTAFKTRLASWMAKESPSVISQVFEKNPKLRDAVYRTFIKEDNTFSDAVKSKLQGLINK